MRSALKEALARSDRLQQAAEEVRGREGLLMAELREARDEVEALRSVRWSTATAEWSRSTDTTATHANADPTGSPEPIKTALPLSGPDASTLEELRRLREVETDLRRRLADAERPADAPPL
jgi:hypothetical protein